MNWAIGLNNFWGTTDSVSILNQIYDWYDDANLVIFDYIPYLQEPSPNAPLPPPSNLVAEINNNEAYLSWDPIPSTTTGYGYKVYYGYSYWPPYNGTGLHEGDSPIDVGNNSSLVLTGLENTQYYFVVTSYDTQGHESWYSNLASASNIQYEYLYLPLVMNKP